MGATLCRKDHIGLGNGPAAASEPDALRTVFGFVVDPD